ncbi:MAG: C13 family peptidase [Betaproteobacteria bacterium]
MRHALRNLGRNLVAGARLALFMPVSRLAFRIDLAQLLLLFLVSAALDFGIDWVRYGPDPYFSSYGAGSEIFAGGLLLLSSAALALAFRQAALTLAVPVIALAAYPLVQIAHALPYAVFDATPAWAWLWSAGEWLLVAWLFALLVRAVAIAQPAGGPLRWPRAVAGGLLLAAPLWIAPMLTPTEPWWKQPAIHGGADPRYPNPASEPVLSAQKELLDAVLGDLDDERPGITDLYFVGFAGDAREDVFRKDVLAARKVMDERWGTDGRSVVLVNNPRTQLDTPFASVSHLRETLNEIGAAMNADEDVAMIYLASHGHRDHTLEVALPPLELAPLTPGVLRALLDEAGIKWRIVVVSACYSGGFIDALKDDYTAVLTASAADRTSFGCGHRSESTFFGEALFQHGLAENDSFTAAFAAAQARVEEREQSGGFRPPSNPQSFVGSAMADKLGELDRGNVARRSGRTI